MMVAFVAHAALLKEASVCGAGCYNAGDARTQALGAALT